MKTSVISMIHLLAGLIFAPLLPGIINRTKAVFAGRRGPPLLQAYFDIIKLLRKGAVYSRTTTWVFRLAPVIGLAAVISAMTLLPAGSAPAPISFAGDVILFAYCFGLLRFFLVAAALDTGSAFEGMGASREVQFSALAEPALLLGLAALARATGSLSLTGMFSVSAWPVAGPALVLVAAALLIVFLAENARIPVDDPNTHLELTMIHEVMVLDYSGPDFAVILYTSSLKLWALGGLLVNIVLSLFPLKGLDCVGGVFVSMVLLSILVGIIESIMARLSLLKVPHLLAGAVALSALALTLVLRFTT
ncbi:MAG TPA: NADH-quinone oxidoreductase subunit H [Kiritimatiellia bacterium]|nr:NADH-quinone oxidoreductase subunit H [Kiritimatiellia bacterium]HQQ04538.1 NADH-quinone oxidoreductase subunit H [Kiritimatiellia bacterium]